MAIAYPLALPASGAERGVTIRMASLVGAAVSPFTGARETYDWGAGGWEADIELPPLARAEAEAWIGWLAALRGRQGSFVMGDPLGAAPRGDAGGAPLVNGAGQSGYTLQVDGAAAGKSPWLAAGDWIQLSSGASRRLHKLVQDAASDGAGNVTLEIWPALRESPADNGPVVVSAAAGRWMLASNTVQYSLELAQRYGIAFSCVEDLRPL